MLKGYVVRERPGTPCFNITSNVTNAMIYIWCNEVYQTNSLK